MPIRFECSKCGEKLVAKDALAGKRIKCKCGELLKIPDAPAAKPSPEPVVLEVAANFGEGSADPAAETVYARLSPGRKRRSARDVIIAVGVIIAVAIAIVLAVYLRGT